MTGTAFEQVDPRWDISCDPGPLGILDVAPPPAFDAITRLAKALFDVPVALVSIVREREDRQYFTSQQGLPHPWCDTRQTPLSHSFCQYVKRSGEELVVEDARAHPVLKSNLAVEALNAVAYLGVPISCPNGYPLGALCVIQDEPREWTDKEVAQLRDLALCVNDEILLRAALLKSTQMFRDLETATTQLRRYSAVRESISQAFMVPDLSVEERFQELLRASCEALDLEYGAIVEVGGGDNRVLFQHPMGTAQNAPQTEESPRSERRHHLVDSVVTGMKMVVLPDLSPVALRDPTTALGHRPFAYAAAPLTLEGSLYGVLEFSSARPHSNWQSEDHDLLSVITMFVNAYLGAYQQIHTLKRTMALPTAAFGPEPKVQHTRAS